MLIFLYIILLKGKKYNHDSQPGKSLEGKEGCSWWFKTTGDLSQSTHGTLPYSNMSPTKTNQIFEGVKRIAKDISHFPPFLPLHSRIAAIMPFCIFFFFSFTSCNILLCQWPCINYSAKETCLQHILSEKKLQDKVFNMLSFILMIYLYVH